VAHTQKILYREATLKGKPPRVPVIMKVVIISEKDIAAAKIAKILSDDGAVQSKMSGVNVYEWKDKKDEYACIGLRGHIITVDYPKQFNQWFRVKPKELIWAEPEKKVDKEAKNIASALESLARDADQVILATDYDREGELIGLEALNVIIQPDVALDLPAEDEKPKKKKKGAKDAEAEAEEEKPKKKKATKATKKAAARTKPLDVKRARFSALTKDEIKRAFSQLTQVDENLAMSAEARQVVDLAWGATLTRFISLASGQVGDDFLSVGRVQSPVLALIVDKEKEIRSFVPVPYWEIHATLQKGETFPAAHQEGRFFEEPQARAVHGRLAGVKKATVKTVTRSERTENPPDPFNTTAFLRAATALGFGAAKAMSVAEDLYTSGWISYPRTDNTVYPPSLVLKDILQKFAEPRSFVAAEAQALLAKGELKPTAGKKTTTDHPPIHPTEVAMRTDLNEEQWKVYELVVRRFLATLSEPSTSESLKVTFDVGGEPFSSNGRRMVKPGFRGVYPYNKGSDILLPQMEEGDSITVTGVGIEAKKTKPPGRMSQGRLIQEMENLGLGTKSTRADILDKLYRRDFVRNNPPEPTETGFAVVDALEKYATIIAKPDMTATLEKEMDEIAEGQRPMTGVILDSRKMLEQVVEVLEENRTLLGQEIRQAMIKKNTIGTCPQCQKGLQIRKGRTGKRFVGCAGYPECTQTYPLPQFGKIMGEGVACQVCKAPAIKIINKGKRPWITCVTMGCEGMKDYKPARKSDAPGEEGGEGSSPAEAVPAGEPAPAVLAADGDGEGEESDF